MGLSLDHRWFLNLFSGCRECTMSKKDIHMTLTFILTKDKEKILLGFKKRGLGVNWWNGFGGKVDPNETIVQAANREVKEECGLDVDVRKGDKVAQVNFSFSHKPEVQYISHVFITSVYSGDVVESEEMTPSWWNVEKIPYESMWPDSVLWLPKVLDGGKLFSDIKYNEKTELIGHSFDEFIGITIVWLPKVLSGDKVTVDVSYNEKNELIVFSLGKFVNSKDELETE